MPELPEVRVVVEGLNEFIINKIIKNVIVLKEKMIKEISISHFKEELINKKIIKIENKGKYIIFHMSGKNDKLFLISHLRMEGKYFFYKNKSIIKKHIHLILEFNDNSELHYMDTRMFGTFHIKHHDYLKVLPLSKLANEPKDINIKDFYEIISNKRRAIKTILLDQSILVGLGNIYVDEVLFKSNIIPSRISNNITLKECKLIIKNAILILDKAFKYGGSTISSYASINLRKGNYQQFLNVHTRKNEKCYACNNLILKTKINGRGTYYCKICQK